MNVIVISQPASVTVHSAAVFFSVQLVCVIDVL